MSKARAWDWVLGAETREAGSGDRSFPLHSLILERRAQLLASQGSTPMAAEAWQTQMEACLKRRRVDVNAIDPYGRSALGLLVLDGRSQAQHPAQFDAGLAVITALVERGANPLIGDEALLMAMEEGGRSYALAAALLKGLIAREAQGQGMRDALGGNAAHVLVAGEGRQTLSWVFPDAQATASQETMPSLPAAWWKQGDDAGDTPLHRLWVEGGKLFKGPQSEGAWEALANSEAWETMATSLPLGADLSAPNLAGISAGERILAAIDTLTDGTLQHWALTVTPEMKAFEQRLRAMAHTKTLAEQLERDTAGAARAKSGPRL